MSQAAGGRWWESRETITLLCWSFTDTWTTDLESMPSMRWEEVSQAWPLKDTKLQHQVSMSSPTVYPNHVAFTNSSEANFITYWTLKHSNLWDNWFSPSFKLQSIKCIFHRPFFFIPLTISPPTKSIFLLFPKHLTRTQKISRSKVICHMKWISTGRYDAKRSIPIVFGNI